MEKIGEIIKRNRRSLCIIRNVLFSLIVICGLFLICEEISLGRIIGKEKSSEQACGTSDNPCPGPSGGWGKPVIYLYPQSPENVKVTLNLDGNLTSSYPVYENGWNVTAYPDGKIINQTDNKEYSYLFWEGKYKEEINYDLSKGFIVKGEDTASFLQDKLSQLGLTAKEYNEFIVYWMPRMQNNKYNLIHFASKEEYDDHARLNIDPRPDSMLRIFMVYEPLDNMEKIEPQEIKPFVRNGFTVVEWGGTEVN